jgi:hypothetical protein
MFSRLITFLQVFACHELIRMRTAELERIHHTSIVLRQFRQFMHAKGQLDYYLKTNQSMVTDNDKDKAMSAASKDHILINGVSFDIRNLANTAAKLVYELESLIHVPILCDITAVSSSAESICKLGQQLRQSAQDRFIVAIKDGSQASIAACLQIFYHLQILPEVILLAIDHVVKATADASADMLDFTALVNEHSELASLPSLARSTSLSASSTTATASTAIPRKGAQQVITMPFPTSASISRSVKEHVNNWMTYMHEQSLQINILQRVVMKKEDPNTQTRFLEILKTVCTAQHPSLLSSGKLLELYWTRLVSSFQDISNRYVKTQPVASSRIYPFLRKAGFEMMKSLKQMTEPATAGSATTAELLTIGSEDLHNIRAYEDDCMFDSLAWDSYTVLDSIAFSSTSHPSHAARESESLTVTGRLLRANSLHGTSGASHHNNISTDFDLDSTEIGFIAGFKPFRDRYLIGTLSRMNIPVHQMFPEMEGYTAAIPSKRDLQTLVKAIQSELVHVVIESDVGLIRYVSREALKSLQLISSKVEDMILNTHDVKKVQLQSTSFVKNHAQDHNAQLIVLLSQLKEAILKLPDQVAGAVGQERDTQQQHENLASHMNQNIISKEISSIFQAAILSIDDLAARQLYAPLLDNLCAYVESVVLTVVSSPLTSATTTAVAGMIPANTIDCSKAVQILQKQVPELLQTFIYPLPKSTIRSMVLEEFALRLMYMYLTIAVLIRPVNEALRLRTSQDLSTIEDMIVNIATISDNSTCRIVQEFK